MSPILVLVLKCPLRRVATKLNGPSCPIWYTLMIGSTRPPCSVCSVTHAAKGVGYLNLSMGFSLEQDPPLVGESGVGVERFVDFHLHVENFIRYRVPSRHSPI